MANPTGINQYTKFGQSRTNARMSQELRTVGGGERMKYRHAGKASAASLKALNKAARKSAMVRNSRSVGRMNAGIQAQAKNRSELRSIYKAAFGKKR